MVEAAQQFNQGDRLSIATHSKTVVLKESSPLMRSQLQRCLVITPSAYKDSYKGAKCLGSILMLPNFLSCSVLFWWTEAIVEYHRIASYSVFSNKLISYVASYVSPIQTGFLMTFWQKLRRNRNPDFCEKSATGTENAGIRRIPAGICNLESYLAPLCNTLLNYEENTCCTWAGGTQTWHFLD